MARFPMQPTTRGHVEVARRKFKAGPLDEGAARDLTNMLEVLRAALNGGLSLGDGEDGARAGNLAAQFRQVKSTSAGGTFAVPHGLGRVPVGYLVVRKASHCDVCDANDRAPLDESTIWIQASVDNVELTLLIF